MADYFRWNSCGTMRISAWERPRDGDSLQTNKAYEERNVLTKQHLANSKAIVNSRRRRATAALDTGPKQLNTGKMLVRRDIYNYVNQHLRRTQFYPY